MIKILVNVFTGRKISHHLLNFYISVLYSTYDFINACRSICRLSSCMFPVLLNEKAISLTYCYIAIEIKIAFQSVWFACRLISGKHFKLSDKISFLHIFDL